MSKQICLAKTGSNELTSKQPNNNSDNDDMLDIVGRGYNNHGNEPYIQDFINENRTKYMPDQDTFKPEV